MESQNTSSSADGQGAGRADEQETIERETRAKWESLRPSYNEWAVNSGEPLSEFDRIVDRQVQHALVLYQKKRASEELEGSSAVWGQGVR